MLMTMQFGTLVFTALFNLIFVEAYAQSPVPGRTPPVLQTTTADYADDTRGIFVPGHKQLRFKSQNELSEDHKKVYLAQASSNVTEDAFTKELQRLAGEGEASIDHIANGQPHAPQGLNQNFNQNFSAPAYQQPRQGHTPINRAPVNRATATNTFAQHTPSFTPDGGVEVAAGQATARGPVDMTNALVRIREERITVRRVVQRMMDQIGASDWTIVWDLSQQNLPLAEMEISIDAHEPFTNVLNALLARLQTRSGNPLRVIRYDNTRRLVITDRATGHRLSGESVSPFGVETDGQVVITERTLKEAMISLHYDEIPLVDALESIVNQAGKGQWRLRIYAGLDQVLKPAHIEEPFGTAMERLLRLFNLKYEIFPGGKLVVVTQTNRFGYGTNTGK